MRNQSEANVAALLGDGWGYEVRKLSYLHKYNPDFVSQDGKTIIEVKGKIGTAGRTDLLYINKFYQNNPFTYVQVRDTASPEVRRLVDELAKHTEVVVEVVPFVERFIVCPVLTETDMKHYDRWKNIRTQQLKSGAMFGKSLVHWLQDHRISHAPISANNMTELEKVL